MTELNIRLAAPVELRASGVESLPTRFSGIAYSGGAAFGGRVVIDLSSTKLAAAKAPLLFEHNRSDIIGAVESGNITAAGITVAGLLFSDIDGCAARDIAKRAVRGAPYQMSVGLFGFTEEAVPQGQSVTVNSRSFAGPIYVLRNGTVREVSIVTLGADPDAEAKLFNAQHSGQPVEKAAVLSARAIYAVRRVAARLGRL